MKTSTIFLQIVIVLIGTLALALLLWEPQIEGVNANATNFEIYFKDPFLALVYIGSIPFFAALYQAFKVLGYVRQNKVFSQAVVQGLRTIKYCAIATIGFVLLEEIFIILNHGNDDAAGGIMVGLFIMFGSILAATTASMFERIVQNAVDRKSL
jgi:hypothetical protein